ncbi:MAG: gamma-glutamylcyclotransferase family protein [Granulosicoccaceae bacterium]
MIAYFGYGSLVNRNTRPPLEDAFKARLSGWERHWAHRVADDATDRHCTSLSARPAADAATSIDGVVVLMEQSELPTLDQRESGYFRQSVPICAFEIETALPVKEVAIYRSLPENLAPANENFPILQSYIDCVMAGYEQLFDEAGLHEFMRTTVGWSGDTLNDRIKPHYPRAVSLSREQLVRFELLIKQYR